ncbi:MAG: c-type cytochrome [Rhodobacteraceae bacterium]|nr:c-type cytochrome [Paracoccaceae bacterium]
MSKFLKACAGALLVASPALADGYGLGRPALTEEIAAWDIDVRPDGMGLPEGSGDVFTGEEIFSEKCAICHGDFGEAVGRWPQLAGGFDTLTDQRPVKTIGSYWPYLSTVYDYVHRAMPFGDAQSLPADDVYAITAYLLYLNDIVDDEFELSHENFAGIRLPNEDNFFLDDRAEVELTALSGEVCMENCKDSVEITMRAAVLDVTPEETKARQLKDAVEAVRNPKPKIDATADMAEAPAEEPAEEATMQMASIDTELAAAGEKLFRQCKSCHQVGAGAKNRSGPVLNAIVGRTAGALEGFRYSRPMQAAGEKGLVWTEDELAAFMANPKTYMKGTKMSFRGFKSDADAKAVIEYLKTFDSAEM